VWIQRMAVARGADITLLNQTHRLATLGLWGPKARETLSKLMSSPDAISPENFPFATAKAFEVAGITVWAFRISYVGEQGFELYFDFDSGLDLWDQLFALGVVPIGVETYANSRRLEKSLRLQNADLETDFNLYEAGLARSVVKKAAFHGKSAYLAQRGLDQQTSYLCTLVMLANEDAEGIKRYPVGEWPILDADTGLVVIDAKGRRSFSTSISYGPSLGRNLLLAYLPADRAKVGETFILEYFCEHYPIRVEAVGSTPVLDPDNERPRS
ncbi:MAG TPA: dehydrogenase, partial [Gammaproteobacteria bacterium]|nr:dehydrogenase [Gammaproteobacteria bacterium]